MYATVDQTCTSGMDGVTNIGEADKVVKRLAILTPKHLNSGNVHVQVCEYDSEWPTQFQKISEDLERILQGVPFVSIEHAGSTYVPGLCAKPVVDIRHCRYLGTSPRGN
jgi:GrpB-like predicted nucleotidyltransferase (UPF0157 family)